MNSFPRELSSLKISFIGLGYVGLPLLVAFSKASSQHDLDWTLVGFDINQKRIDDLRLCNDHTCEVLSDDLKSIQPFVSFTSSEDDLSQSDIFIITVPTLLIMIISLIFSH